MSTTHAFAIATFALAAALAGCASARPEPETAPVARRADESAGGAAAAQAPPRRPGEVRRDEVEAALRAGIGSFLARVEVSPVLSRGRFVGFRLDDAADLAAWQAAGADIRRGDVIVRVNGVRVERPEQALWAFERLRIVPAIEVEMLRDGAPVTLRAPIVGDAPVAN